MVAPAQGEELDVERRVPGRDQQCGGHGKPDRQAKEREGASPGASWFVFLVF